MQDIMREIYLNGIVPAVKIKDAEKAVPVAKAIARGGVSIIEITFRSDAAAEAIARISKECPDMLVGAGTILTREQVDAAVAAGAKFIVAPGFNPDTVKYCVEKNIPIIPGCSSCGEMEQAISLGIGTVKFFPAEAMGGVAYLKSVSGPYRYLKFMPTGGIDAKNINNYLALPCVSACGGSFMAKEALIDACDYDAVERLTAEAVRAMLGLEIRHIGINCNGDGEAAGVADLLCRFFDVEADDRGGAIFAGTLFEVLKSPFRGEKGHVAIATNSPDRARAHLEKLGFEFDESTASYQPDGRLKVVYTKSDIGGFAFHLIQK